MRPGPRKLDYRLYWPTNEFSVHFKDPNPTGKLSVFESKTSLFYIVYRLMLCRVFLPHFCELVSSIDLKPLGLTYLTNSKTSL